MKGLCLDCGRVTQLWWWAKRKSGEHKGLWVGQCKSCGGDHE